MRSLVTGLIEDYRQQASYWAGSLFESVTHFSTDYKGKFGEELLFRVIKDLTDIPVQWDADSNTANDDGVYDLTISGISWSSLIMIVMMLCLSPSLIMMRW
jgi:hypothetical protein